MTEPFSDNEFDEEVRGALSGASSPGESAESAERLKKEVRTFRTGLEAPPARRIPRLRLALMVTALVLPFLIISSTVSPQGRNFAQGRWQKLIDYFISVWEEQIGTEIGDENVRAIAAEKIGPTNIEEAYVGRAYGLLADGNHLLICVSRSQAKAGPATVAQASIWLVNVRDGTYRPIHEGKVQAREVFPHRGANGSIDGVLYTVVPRYPRKNVITGRVINQETELWYADFVKKPRMIFEGRIDVRANAVSPDGRTVAFKAYGKEAETLIYDFDQQKSSVISSAVMSVPIAWSADSGSLILAENRYVNNSLDAAYIQRFDIAQAKIVEQIELEPGHIWYHWGSASTNGKNHFATQTGPQGAGFNDYLSKISLYSIDPFRRIASVQGGYFSWAAEGRNLIAGLIGESGSDGTRVPNYTKRTIIDVETGTITTIDLEEISPGFQQMRGIASSLTGGGSRGSLAARYAEVSSYEEKRLGIFDLATMSLVRVFHDVPPVRTEWTPNRRWIEGWGMPYRGCCDEAYRFDILTGEVRSLELPALPDYSYVARINEEEVVLMNRYGNDCSVDDEMRVVIYNLATGEITDNPVRLEGDPPSAP